MPSNDVVVLGVALGSAAVFEGVADASRVALFTGATVAEGAVPAAVGVVATDVGDKVATEVGTDWIQPARITTSKSISG